MEFKVVDIVDWLKLIKRPKKKVKKTIELWANIYPGGREVYHSDKDVADTNASFNRVTCVKLTGEYEVEE